MFVAIYQYKVPPKKTKQYITLEKQAIQIYMEHGCLGVELYRDSKDPRRWMEINRFMDLQHYNQVTAAVDQDDRIGQLFKDFISLFDDEDNKPEKTTYYRMI